jgi:plastocyanin
MRGRQAIAIALAAIAALAAAIGCGEEEREGPVTVVITDEGYQPSELTIEAGDRVTFVNRSKERPGSAKDDPTGDVEVSPQPGPTAHDGSEVNRASRKGFATHSLFRGERQTVIFPIPMTYEYSSAFNPDLKGTITVAPRGE